MIMRLHRRLHTEARGSKLEKRWTQFFEDPGIWWDNRSKNWSPEFKHAVTGEGLFISSSPQWVRDKLSSLEVPIPGSKGFRARYRGRDKTASDFLAALKQCSKTRDFRRGKELHREALVAKCHTDRYVAAALITMYSKCHVMASAKEVFDGMPRRDTVAWNTLILGYAENGESSVAMDLFAQMDCELDSFTYVAALKACGGLGAEEKGSRKETWLEKGINLHRNVKERELEANVLVSTTLIDMYSKCGDMQRAQEVFDRMTARNVVSWNCLIMGYVDNGKSEEALRLLTSMDLEPTPVTYVAALKACARLAAEVESRREVYRVKGGELHRQVEERGFDTDILVMTTLMDMYTNCGCMELALEVFSNLKCEPSAVTYVGALKACSGLANQKESEKQKCLDKGVAIHKTLQRCGLCSDQSVANTLLDMYIKCGSVSRAREFFQTLSCKDVVTWTCLILGYVMHGESQKALELFTNMDVEPDPITYVAALQACGSIASLFHGRSIHEKAVRYGLEQEQVLWNALVDMYSKCSNMTRAEQTINTMSSLTIVSWNALLSGYSSLGETEQVFDITDLMHRAELPLNGVTFICILAACSHVGKVDEGKRYFDSMTSRYHITPNVEHYTCMIDILGRANRLEEALSFLNSMSIKADPVTWRAILGACRKWKNPEIGKLAFDALVAENRKDAAAYVLLREIYDDLAMERDVESVDAGRVVAQAWRTPGRAWWCCSDGKVVEFCVGDTVDKDVEKKLNGLMAGLRPDDKQLCGHSERLAVVHGIVHASPGEVIQVVKNIRMCNGCHRITAKISNMERREIIVRDASRVHIFRNGICSCDDYW